MEEIKEEWFQRTIYVNHIREVNDYFVILEKPKVVSRKTSIYEIYEKNTTGCLLGEIKWYGAWRKFCFFPNEKTIWDTKCLTKITEFLDKTNKEYREEMKRK